MLKALCVDDWAKSRRSGFDRVRDTVNTIIEEVRAHGDNALIEYARKFDGVQLDHVKVRDVEIKKAYSSVDPKLIGALTQSEARITRFHELQTPPGLWLSEVEPGVTLGVKTTPLERIGCYVPGGSAAYPSTVLMTVTPARVAGVEEVCVTTPPPIHPLTLVALDIAGAEEIYRCGGAQAIAAMALGTESIRPVQKIVGPGNVYVTAAKMMLREYSEIDFPAGPSEVAVIADSSANPDYIAADILAQAEHDPNSACVLLTDDQSLVENVSKKLYELTEHAERKSIIEQALENSGYVLCSSLSEGADIANDIAPEHLSIMVRDNLSVLNKVKNAGSIFVGPLTAVAFGDYASGTNHVLPTAGYAGIYSGLDVNHFLKRSSVQILEQEGFDALSAVAETIARAEGLPAHADSIKIRRK